MRSTDGSGTKRKKKREGERNAIVTKEKSTRPSAGPLRLGARSIHIDIPSVSAVGSGAPPLHAPSRGRIRPILPFLPTQHGRGSLQLRSGTRTPTENAARHPPPPPTRAARWKGVYAYRIFPIAKYSGSCSSSASFSNRRVVADSVSAPVCPPPPPARAPVPQIPPN
jgi:hypothetical protein